MIQNEWARSKSQSGIWTIAGLVAVLGVFLVSGVVTYQNTQLLQRNTKAIMQTHESLLALSQLLSLVQDAETGQRGYVITGDDRYLGPYYEAVTGVEAKLKQLEDIADSNPEHRRAMLPLRSAVDTRLSELNKTLALRRSEGFDAARQVVGTGRGKASMEQIHSIIEQMQQNERQTRFTRINESELAYLKALNSGLLATLVGAAVTIAIAYQTRQSSVYRLRQERLLTEQLKLNQQISGDLTMERLGENILKTLGESFQASTAAFYAFQGGSFRLAATLGVPAGAAIPNSFSTGDGLLGQAVREKRRIVLHDVPDGYLTFGSALGSGKPRSLAIMPVSADTGVNGIIELGFLNEIDDSFGELFERASEAIGTAIRSVNYRVHLQELLEETQRQSEELQAQSEELRVANEELEEQSRALRESQARLENQQAELEQTNSQLEEQTQLLEHERDEVTRGQAVLEVQAKQLEAASRYKSEFLANMSHELRTPLNSSLILAKLLADNPAGNLTDEQVRYAETIRTAGNDLLVLINDILDLSKIEAGHLEIRPESFPLARLVESLNRTFRPMAQDKRLQFQIEISEDCPTTMQTDRQRLEQVLKNLLSNACKFTEAGEVTLRIAYPQVGRLEFAVSDTGIGISPTDQKVVFDAFRQADSQTSRKYGGTGLGLSISRELARLLGGTIELQSQPGAGSTFTLSIPEVYTPRATPSSAIAEAAVKPVAAPVSVPAIKDVKSAPRVPNRILPTADSLSPSRRLLLIVEDDPKFSAILENMADELDFDSRVASTAEDAVAQALQWIPSAVILDLGLPDHSGLWVLDRLKHDSRTRHVPVHVVSASDEVTTARSLGAVGYLVKPVQLDDLAEVLKQLAGRLSDRKGMVLVIEDDPVQRDSVRELLKSLHVETVGAASAAEALERLKSTTFDCMVLDLSLPDASGISLLETLSEQESYAFPPAIVYTGRDLAADEEQRLRRYSKSIIIKGAKSPERLLDEVTLFLHRVVSELPLEQQRMLEQARSRDAALENRRILIVEDDVRNVFALTSVLEPRGAKVLIARNGREALTMLEASRESAPGPVDLVLMDVMMPEMDGLTAVRKIREIPAWKKLPVIMLTAKAMKDDHENCLAAGASDYMAKPLDVEKLLSLIRVWMPR